MGWQRADDPGAAARAATPAPRDLDGDGWKAEQVAASALMLPRERSASVTTEVAVAREKGYNGRACPECGQFTVRYKGKCEGCDSCSWTGGCS